MSVRTRALVACLVVLSPAVYATTMVHAAPVLQVSHRPGAAPGDIVWVSVTSSEPLTDVAATAFGRPVLFWQAAPEGAWHALVGIGLETKPGAYEMSIRATGARGDVTALASALTVGPGTFETRRLQVASQFVDPPGHEAARIASDAKRLADTFAQVSPQRLWSGAFALPVPGKPTSSFGRLTVLNGQPRGRHQGADFAAPQGTPVRAPNAGRVALAADLYFAGNTVILDHGLGLFSLFAHLSRIDVREGTLVPSGAVLGASGATGRVTGPHLHWAVRMGEISVNPVSLVSASAEMSAAPPTVAR